MPVNVSEKKVGTIRCLEQKPADREILDRRAQFLNNALVAVVGRQANDVLPMNVQKAQFLGFVRVEPWIRS